MGEGVPGKFSFKGGFGLVDVVFLLFDNLLGQVGLIEKAMKW